MTTATIRRHKNNMQTCGFGQKPDERVITNSKSERKRIEKTMQKRRMSYEAKSRRIRGYKGVHVPVPIPSTPARKADEGTSGEGRQSCLSLLWHLLSLQLCKSLPINCGHFPACCNLGKECIVEPDNLVQIGFVSMCICMHIYTCIYINTYKYTYTHIYHNSLLNLWEFHLYIPIPLTTSPSISAFHPEASSQKDPQIN